MSKRQSAYSAEDYRSLLRNAGLRVTEARVAVLRFIRESPSPVTHAETAQRLLVKGFDRVTVYRKLLELSRSGLLTRTELGDHLWRFEFRNREIEHSDDHPHFLCIDCGLVTCLPRQSVKLGLMPGVNDTVIAEVSEILLKGRCNECLRQSN
ncbi:MAG TPA: transcriptional repressor [Polyangiaceae bacterium]|jgi:Fur family ferric uptake transcriptional regulator